MQKTIYLSFLPNSVQKQFFYMILESKQNAEEKNK